MGITNKYYITITSYVIKEPFGWFPRGEAASAVCIELQLLLSSASVGQQLHPVLVPPTCCIVLGCHGNLALGGKAFCLAEESCES